MSGAAVEPQTAEMAAEVTRSRDLRRDARSGQRFLRLLESSRALHTRLRDLNYKQICRRRVVVGSSFAFKLMWLARAQCRTRVCNEWLVILVILVAGS